MDPLCDGRREGVKQLLGNSPLTMFLRSSGTLFGAFSPWRATLHPQLWLSRQRCCIKFSKHEGEGDVSGRRRIGYWLSPSLERLQAAVLELLGTWLDFWDHRDEVVIHMGRKRYGLLWVSLYCHECHDGISGRGEKKAAHYDGWLNAIIFSATGAGRTVHCTGRCTFSIVNTFLLLPHVPACRAKDSFQGVLVRVCSSHPPHSHNLRVFYVRG